MKVIIPLEAQCQDIIEGTYNVPFDTNVSQWVSTTSYAKGDKVTLDNCGAVVYESISSSNSGNNPAVDDGSNWLEIGTSNYFGMFDSRTGTQTINPNSIELEMNFNSLINSVALINVDAVDVRFEVWDSNNAKIYDKTYSLIDSGVSNWFDYFFEPIGVKDRLVKFDIPQVITGRGKMTLTKPQDNVKLGGLIFGRQFLLGQSQWGASVGIKDYSTKEVDQFGNYFVLERAFNDKLNVDIQVDLNAVTNVKRELAKYRATPLLWVAEESFGSTIVYGYYRTFDIILSHPAFADCNIEIEGVS